MLAAAGGGHGHAPMPVSGGSHAHAGATPSEAHEPYAEMQAQDSRPWPDITLKEGLTLFPLAVLTVVVGVYPGPILDLIKPAVDRILAPFM
jgi:NADH-quinone oxidoreductase subunit M